jgi:predicted TIM-barrel fold metal-dependent hydrolase
VLCTVYKGRSETVSKDRPLVDAHVHLYPDADTGHRAKSRYQIWEYGEDPGVHFDTAAGVVREVSDRFEATGFDQVVVLQLFDLGSERARLLSGLEPGLPPTKAHGAARLIEDLLVEAFEAANRWVIEATRNHPLLTAYVGIDPNILGPSRIGPHLMEMAALGARGVKLHPVSQGFNPADPRLAQIYQLCCELNLVVLSHSGPGHRRGASARPSDFAPVLNAWPDLRLVLAHLGGAAFAEASDLAQDFPQVAFDLSEIIEWVGAPNAPSLIMISDTVRQIGAERIMLGSDFPWYEPTRSADKVASLPGLGEEERALLLGGSAATLLSLELGSSAQVQS